MRWLILPICLCLIACGAPPKVFMRLSGGPDDALVHINDRYVGKLGRLVKTGIKLEPGEYRITVDAVGYFPHDELVKVEELGPPPKLEVQLQEVPD